MPTIPVELICAGVAILVYANTFDADFVYDDSRAILKNLDVRTSTPLYNVFLDDFWGTRMTHSGSHKSYRPITTLTFRFNYLISGFDPCSYHLTNILLHAICTCLFVAFFKSRIFIKDDSNHFKSTVAGLLFAVHPVHTEAVAGVVGRADVLSCIFVLATLMSYARHCDDCDFDYGQLGIKKTNYSQERAVTSQISGEKQQHKRKVKFRRKDKRRNHSTTIAKSSTIATENVFNDVKLNSRPYKEQTPSKFWNEIFLKFAEKISVFHENIFFKHTVTLLNLTYASAVLAILSKEHGASALPLCAIYDIWINNKLGISSTFRVMFWQVNSERLKNMRQRIWKLVISTLVLLSLRILPWYILSSSTSNSLPTFSSADNPVSANESIFTRTMTFHYLLFFNTKLLICPTELSYDWGGMSLVESIWDSRNLCTIIFYVVLFLMGRRLWRSLRENDAVFQEYTLNESNHQNFDSEHNSARETSKSCDINPEGLKNLAARKTYNTEYATYQTALLKALLDQGEVGSLKTTDDEGIHLGTPSCTNQVKDINKNDALNAKQVADSQMEKKSLLHVPNTKFISREIPESTNSSGYATESGEESHEKVPHIDVPGNKDLPSQTRVETLNAFQDNNEQLSVAFCSNDQINVTLMGVSIMIFSFIPATNLFFYVGFVVAERILYLPSAGFCIIVAEGMGTIKTKLERMQDKNKNRYLKIMKLCGMIFLLALSLKTINRNKDWSNEFNLYRSGVMTSPAKSWANLGNVLKVQGRIKQVEVSYINALKARGNMADVHYNLGLLYQEQHRYEEAMYRYKTAIQHRPTLAVAHLNIGIILAELGKFEEAEKVYRHIVTIEDTGLRDPQGHARTKVSASYNLGCMLSSQGRHKEAVTAYLDAVDRLTKDYEPHSLYNMLGQSLFKLNRYEEAEKWFQESLNVKPDHVPVHLTYATLLSRTNRLAAAENLYKKAIILEPQNHVIYNHLGKFYSDRGRYFDAAQVMEDAVMTQSGSRDYDSLMTAGDTHRYAKIYDKSEKYYRMATNIYPKAVEAHINLGGILHLQEKYSEAKQSYHKALKLKPNDPTATDNLRKLEEILKRRTKV